MFSETITVHIRPPFLFTEENSPGVLTLISIKTKLKKESNYLITIGNF